MRRAPALIVGGGPAGAAAAIVLARGGAPHLLVERTREPADALCGGFLSWRTLETLAALGVAEEELGGERIGCVRLFAGPRRVETTLPRAGMAVSRLRLDALLLERATAAGARIERGVTARSIEGRLATLDDTEIDADTLFLASGKHEVRGAARPVETEEDPTLGLRVRLAGTPAWRRLVGGAVELHLFEGGYAGIALQEDGSANVCLAVRRSRLRAAGAPIDLLRSLARASTPLADRLATLEDATPVDAVANVPYGWSTGKTEAGVFRLGDQAGVIPSLAGEGMGIALASGISAARAHLSGTSADRWQQDFARTLTRPIGIADRLRHWLERPAPARTLLAVAAAAPTLVRGVARATRIKCRRGLNFSECFARSHGMEKIDRTDAEWRERLSPEQYHVLREAGTEQAFAGELNDNKADGIYACAACGNSLFDSADKYDSGSGWPSFTRPIEPGAVEDHADTSHGMTRTETRCARCDSHLGHVFPDGPPPTRLRYCMNSLSLDFAPRN